MISNFSKNGEPLIKSHHFRFCSSTVLLVFQSEKSDLYRCNRREKGLRPELHRGLCGPVPGLFFGSNVFFFKRLTRKLGSDIVNIM